MAKTERKPKLIQSIYKEIEKTKGKGLVKGNPNTIKQMKKGTVNPTVSTLCHILNENGFDGSITLKYEGTTSTFDFNV